MKKAVDLRAHLEKWVPDLAANPDKLHLIIEKGGISTKPGATLAFQFAYTLQIIVTDFAESPDVVIVPLLVWLQTNQPDLLQDPVRRERAIVFEAEGIDHDKADIQFTLELTERVLVRDVPAGYECTHVGEPQHPDLTGPTGWQIYLKGQPLTEDNG